MSTHVGCEAKVALVGAVDDVDGDGGLNDNDIAGPGVVEDFAGAPFGDGAVSEGCTGGSGVAC